ncbi:MAG: hypothetical protein IRZ10_01410 [Thermoflavifilum sp.]|nr:hypothetical protein [Thermoflavifilum sp.]MCL6513046.1 hypothetical protein [Alicyclobacillus sp.]
MKKSALRATLLAYLGLVLLVASFLPMPDAWFDMHPVLHTTWHLAKLISAALIIYGLETLRLLARRQRRLGL